MLGALAAGIKPKPAATSLRWEKKTPVRGTTRGVSGEKQAQKLARPHRSNAGSARLHERARGADCTRRIFDSPSDADAALQHGLASGSPQSRCRRLRPSCGVGRKGNLV